MHLLIAVDSFKDALDASGVAQAMERGARLALPDARITVFPLADGGEGTLEALVRLTGGAFVTTSVQDPLFREITARWGRSADGSTAFIGMSEASGIQLLKQGERNCTFTTSLGTGQLMLEALRQGVKRIVLAIGGSATHDVGVGMATALGYRFLDAQGEAVVPIGGNLETIERIDDTHLLFDPAQVEWVVLCDVDNPLFGPQGAAHTYARQKGATGEEIDRLEAGTRRFAQILEAHFRRPIANIPGAGAAGGMGAGAMAFLGAQKKRGAEAVLELSGFEEALATADLVLTGEGRIDEQTRHGKLVMEIVRRANRRQTPVVGLCGTLALPPEAVKSLGLQAAFSCLDRPLALAEALPETARALEHLAYHVCRLATSFPRKD